MKTPWRLAVLVSFLGWVSFFAGGCGPSGKKGPVALNNGLALTPPMGWDSWNHFGLHIDADLIRQVADAMGSNGMRDAGYQYVIIDDGWALKARSGGHLQPNPSLFPGGLKPLADYIHSRGLKFGLYASRGRLTCGGTGAGCHGFEAVDAADFAAWGVDYLKYDNCDPPLVSSEQEDYRRMGEALAATGRPIVYGICAWAFKDWMPLLGNLWRTTPDLTDQWDSMMAVVGGNESWASYAGPGRWNDPDMLQVGNSDVPPEGPSLQGIPHPGMSHTEYEAQFSLWAVMAAPLIAGNDVRSMNPGIREILLNREIIGVDQDPLGLQGKVAWENPSGLEILSKPLADGGRAVVLLNASDFGSEMTAHWYPMGLRAFQARVRDLWLHQDMGRFKESYTAYVPSHSVVMLKISPLNR